MKDQIQQIKTNVRSIRNRTIIRSQIYITMSMVKAIEMEHYNEILARYHIKRWYAKPASKKCGISVFDLELPAKDEGTPIEKIVTLSHTLVAIHLNIMMSTTLSYQLKNMLLEINEKTKSIAEKQNSSRTK